MECQLIRCLWRLERACVLARTRVYDLRERSARRVFEKERGPPDASSLHLHLLSVLNHHIDCSDTGNGGLAQKQNKTKLNKNKKKTRNLQVEPANSRRENAKRCGSSNGFRQQMRTSSPSHIRTTAGTPTAYTADGSVAGSFGRVVPRGRRHELLSLWGLRFFTEWTRLTWAVRRSPAGRVECNQWCVPAPASLLRWDVESRS